MQVDNVVEHYREIAKFPTVSLARVANLDTAGYVRVYSQWTQRDLERSETVKFSRNHIIHLNDVFSTPPSDVTSEMLHRESWSGRYQAILRKITNKNSDDKYYIEIWNDGKKINNIDLGLNEQHGRIYHDVQFGCLEWSYSETHLLYVAEKKQQKSKSFFDRSTDDTKSTVGDEYVYRDNWGEQLNTSSVPVLCVLDIESGAVSILENLPDEISPGQAMWCTGDLGVICVGWWHEPYRLGLTYCPIRRSALFHIDLKTSKCSILGTDDHAVRCPRFSPDHSKLVYLDNDVGGPHAQCSRLMMCDWSTKGIVPVVDIVRNAPASEFQGIYQGLNLRCWSEDNNRIVIATQWRSKKELVVIHTETGTVTRLTQDPEVGSWTLHDIHKDLIVASCSSPNQPPYLVLGTLPQEGREETISWTKLDADVVPMNDISWKIFSMKPHEDQVNKEFSSLDYECYLLEPKLPDLNVKPPLVAYLHGGPHSVFVAEFMPYLAGLCRCGFTVLTVNYRGSIGFGQDSIQSLIGNAGSQDVLDCQNAIQYVLDELEVIDKNNVFVIGGSHGGFLTTHLIGQFPAFYKAAVARNPVINIASMLGCTDIPDWCCVESGVPYCMDSKNGPEHLKAMWKQSPIQYSDKIETPVMIMLGEDDRRVPPHQGHELRKILLARGVKCRTLVYPGNGHPITKVDSEADAFVNIVNWFIQHTVVAE